MGQYLDKSIIAFTNASNTFDANQTVEGTLVVRQSGGTPGTDEVQISHSGSLGLVECRDGPFKLKSSTAINLDTSSGTYGLVFGTESTSNPSLIRSGAATLDLYGVVNNAISVWGTIKAGTFYFGPADIIFRAAGGASEFEVLNNTTTAFKGMRVSQCLFAGTSGTTVDVGFIRIDTNVIGINDASSGTGWLQNSAGEAALESAYTDTDATLGNTALSLNVIAGRSYRIEGLLIISNSTAGEGAKFDFDGGTATATTFAVAFNAVGGTPVAGTIVATALATDLNYTSLTGTSYVFVRGYLEVNGAGTFVLRAAEDTTGGGGTMTLAAGSWLALYDTVDK